MELDFYSSDYGEDFEAMTDLPNDWPHEDDDMLNDVWFKAYDTSLKEICEDAELFEQGYLFNCYVRVRYHANGVYCEDELAKFPARDREDAERLLKVAADALYGKEHV